MPITFNNGVANIVGTPGAASGVFSNRPNAADVAEGTLYFSIDTEEIYQAVSGAWVNYTAGGGSTPNLQQVLIAGNVTDQTANFFSGDNATIIEPILVQINNNALDEFSSHYYNYSQFDTDKTLFRLDQTSLYNKFVDTLNESKIDFTDDSIIKTKYNDGGAGYIDIGLKLDFANKIYYFGNFDNVNNNNAIVIDDGTNFIYTAKGIGFALDFASFLFTLGDYDSANNGTYIQVNDGTQKIKLRNTAGSYNISNMPAYTDNADALANGLVVGDLYRHAGLLESQDQLRIVH